MTPLFPGLIAVSRAVVYCCSAFWLFGFVETQQIIGFQLVPFLTAAILCYLVLRAFLSRPRPLPAVAVLAIVLGGVSATVLIWKFSMFSGPLSLCLGISFLGAVVVRAVQICTNPITAAQSISALERCTGFFIVFLWFQGAMNLPAGYSLPLMAASLLSLVAVLYQRLSAGSETDGSRKWLRGLIAVTALLLLIAAALLLFYRYGSGPLTQAVLAVFAGIKFVLAHLWQWIQAFLTWLASFVSDSGPQEFPEATPAFTPEIPEEAELPDPRIYAIAAVIGICLLLVAALWFLFRLRHFRISGTTAAPKKTGTIRRRVPLLQWLHRIWERIAGRIRLRFRILSMRGTPQELYYFLTRAGRHLGLRKASGETPCAFIRRVRAVPSVQSELQLSDALLSLEAALQESLYSPRQAEPLPQAQVRCIRQQFRRALRQARWAELKALPSRLLQGERREASHTGRRFAMGRVKTSG